MHLSFLRLEMVLTAIAHTKHCVWVVFPLSMHHTSSICLKDCLFSTWMNGRTSHKSYWRGRNWSSPSAHGIGRNSRCHIGVRNGKTTFVTDMMVNDPPTQSSCHQILLSAFLSNLVFRMIQTYMQQGSLQQHRHLPVPLNEIRHAHVAT